MEQIDYDIDDFIAYCEVKNLSKKTVASYEQALRLFAIFLKRECNVKEAGEVKEIHIMEKTVGNINNKYISPSIDNYV